jgi:hypothetical protein
MNTLLAFLMNLRSRHLATFLSQHGRLITIAIRESQTIDDAPQHPSPEQRYKHSITATWTDPQSRKTYVFARQFRSSQAVHFKVGDITKVLIDPRDYRRYLMYV